MIYGITTGKVDRIAPVVLNDSIGQLTKRNRANKFREGIVLIIVMLCEKIFVY